MTSLWVLYALAGVGIGSIIGYFLIMIFTKIRVLLFRKQSNKFKKELDETLTERFYKQFGFYYEDIIKYAPELDTFLSNRVHQSLKDDVSIKMISLISLDDIIRIVNQIDILKYKQTIENIKNQKSLENING